VGKQNYMKIAGKKYELVEFHIQAASDHSIDGRTSPLEAHFVHKDEKNNLAILGVLIEAGAQNKSFAEMWEFVPHSLHNPATPIAKVFNIASLVPAKTKVYRYRGSHSSPPCAGNVLWSIASEKMTMSKEQIEAFRTRSKVNSRPAPVKLNLAH
jgi:carbonic anhydrase